MDGLVTIVSDFGPKETAERFVAAVRAQKLNVFARIDHAAGAAEVGMTLRPTHLIIFGNARGGTPLMQEAQTVGIDLPLKVLVWEDSAGQTWLSYNAASWIADRHNIADSHSEVSRIATGLSLLSAKATTPDLERPHFQQADTQDHNQ